MSDPLTKPMARRRRRSLRVTVAEEPRPVELAPEDRDGHAEAVAGPSDPPSPMAATPPSPPPSPPPTRPPRSSPPRLPPSVDPRPSEPADTVVEAPDPAPAGEAEAGAETGSAPDPAETSVEVDVADFEAEPSTGTEVIVQRMVTVGGAAHDPASLPPDPDAERVSSPSGEVPVEMEELDAAEAARLGIEEVARTAPPAEREAPTSPSGATDVEELDLDVDGAARTEAAEAEAPSHAERPRGAERTPPPPPPSAAPELPSDNGAAALVGRPPPPPKVGARTPPPPRPAPEEDPAEEIALPPPPPAAPGVEAPPPPPSPEMEAGGATPGEGPEWWRSLFDDDYLRTVPIPVPKNIKRQCDFIVERLGLAPGATLLDVGCGLGLHAVELTRRGYLVVGLDLSQSMLQRAEEEAKEHGLPINFLHADMREMTFDGGFDAVLCWGTTFGYFDDETNRRTIRRIYDALKPKGLLLLDVVNRDFVIRQQPNLVWFEGDGCVVMEETQCNFISSRLRVKRTVILDDGRQHDTVYSLRLYSLHELGKILHQRGFRVVEVSGLESHPGVFFGADSPKMIVLAERRPKRPRPSGPPTGRLPKVPDGNGNGDSDGNGDRGSGAARSERPPTEPAAEDDAPELSPDDVEPLESPSDPGSPPPRLDQTGVDDPGTT
ncbi:MAG: methyltransferase domain-containing protein [Sandaracinaceae bacterium]